MRKRPHEKVVRTTVSMAPVLFNDALEMARREGFTGFSALIQWLIREHQHQGTHGSR